MVYDGKVARTEADEYVEIRNRGARINISGWSLRAGDKGQRFVFPDRALLETGQAIRVYTNETHPEWGGYSFGSRRSVWSNRGNTARLFNVAGVEVASHAYGDARDLDAQETPDPWQPLLSHWKPFAFMATPGATDAEIAAWEAANELPLCADVRNSIATHSSFELPAVESSIFAAESTLAPISDWHRMDRSSLAENNNDLVWMLGLDSGAFPSQSPREYVLIGEDPLGIDYGYFVMLHPASGTVYEIQLNIPEVKPLGSMSEWISNCRLPWRDATEYRAAWQALWRELEGEEGTAATLIEQYLWRVQYTLQSEGRARRWHAIDAQFRAVFDALP